MRSPQASRRHDSGLTLPELLITMVVTSVIFLVAGAMTVSSIRERRVVDNKSTSQADARLALEQLSRELRVAVPPPLSTGSGIAFASERKITFYSSLGGSTPVIWKITYEVDATSSCLRRTAIKAVNSTFPSANALTKCLTPGPVNTSGEAVFAYLPLQTDAASAPPAIGLPVAGLSSPADEDTLKGVAGVRVTLWVRAQGDTTVTPTAVDQLVTLINHTNRIRQGS